MVSPVHFPPKPEGMQSWQEHKIKAQVHIEQKHMDGLFELLTWVNGFEAAKSTHVPGKYGTKAVYDMLASAVRHHGTSA